MWKSLKACWKKIFQPKWKIEIAIISPRRNQSSARLVRYEGVSTNPEESLQGVLKAMKLPSLSQWTPIGNFWLYLEPKYVSESKNTKRFIGSRRWELTITEMV